MLVKRKKEDVNRLKVLIKVLVASKLRHGHKLAIVLLFVKLISLVNQDGVILCVSFFVQI